VIDFLLDIDTPYRYIERFSTLLYPDYKVNVKTYALSVCNDSFFTYAQLLYSSKSIALACIIYAAAKFGYSIPSEDET
jgi:hypothetical protein